MSKFIIKDTQLCFVTWTYQVEAANKTAALVAHNNGESEAAGPPEIGDSSGLVDGQFVVNEVS